MKPPRLFFAAMLAAAAAHAELPANLEITYEIQRNGSTVAEVTGRLEQSGGRYQLTETWKGKGIFALLGRAKRSSEGTVGKEGVRPREFADERSGRDTARASFDWNAKTVTYRYRGKERTEPMPPNPQDRISFMLALSKLPPGAKALDVHLIDGKGVSHHVYEFKGRERVGTPAGEFDTLKYVYAKENARTEIWLAPSVGNLPVRMLATEKDNRADQFATRISR